MPKIFLTEDHPLFCEGVRCIVERESDLVVVGDARRVGEALEAIDRLSPDLVLTDLLLADGSGLELIKELKIRCPVVPVLVLSMHDEMLYAERVVQAGGRGYLMKQLATCAVLLQAIRRVLAGGIYLSSGAAAFVLSGMSGRREEAACSRLDRLTDRELEVFELVGRGANVRQIAGRLQISPRTVDAHRIHIREKLGLKDAAALIRYAVSWAEVEVVRSPASQEAGFGGREFS
ncbi:response regulator transcription factor [soil metagenome]